MSEKDPQYTEIKWVEGAGVYTVVPMTRMEAKMKDGWRPLGMFRDYASDFEEHDRVETRGGSSYVCGRESRIVMRKRMCCLMVLDSTLLVAATEARVKKALAGMSAAQENLWTLRQQAEKAEQRATEAEGRLQKSEAATQEIVNESQRRGKRLQALEAEIAHVRRVIGEKAWNDALKSVE